MNNEIVGRAAACVPKGLALMANVQAMYEKIDWLFGARAFSFCFLLLLIAGAKRNYILQLNRIFFRLLNE